MSRSPRLRPLAINRCHLSYNRLHDPRTNSAINSNPLKYELSSNGLRNRLMGIDFARIFRILKSSTLLMPAPAVYSGR